MTICWNRLTTFCRSASISGVISGSISGSRSTRARRKGSVAVNSRGADARDAFAEQQQVVLGNADRLVHDAHGADLVEIVRRRARPRAGSSCETTASVRFSPSDCTSASEAGRPTVMGSSAPGKITVSRTVRTGSSSERRLDSRWRTVRDFVFFGHGVNFSVTSRHGRGVDPWRCDAMSGFVMLYAPFG